MAEDILKNTRFQSRFPTKIRTSDDLMRFAQYDVVEPYAPAPKPLRKSDHFVTLGSCFSQHMADGLTSAGLNVVNFSLSERLFSTFALKDFVGALDGGDLPEELADDVQENVDQFPTLKSQLVAGCTLVMTLGIGVCWFHKETGALVHNVIPRKTSADDPEARKQAIIQRMSEHEMRVTTPGDNRDNILSVIESVRSLNPDNKIVFTVSPIPLQFLQSDQFPIVTADQLSKSVLRLAIAEIEQMNLDNVYYFPSFEIVRGVLPHFPGDFWGSPHTDGDARHLDPQVPRLITQLFVKYFFEDADAILAGFS